MTETPPTVYRYGRRIACREIRATDATWASLRETGEAVWLPAFMIIRIDDPAVLAGVKDRAGLWRRMTAHLHAEGEARLRARRRAVQAMLANRR